MSFLGRVERERNQKGLCAFCGISLAGLQRQRVPMGDEGSSVVLSCPACAARIRRRTWILASIVMLFVVTMMAATLWPAFGAMVHGGFARFASLLPPVVIKMISVLAN